MNDQATEARQETTASAEAQTEPAAEDDALDGFADQRTNDEQTSRDADQEAAERAAQSDQTNDAAEASEQTDDPAAVPESAEGYTLSLPEGFKEIPGLVEAFRGAALKAGLSQGQFQAVADAWHGYAAELNGQHAKLAAEVRAEEQVRTRQRFGLKAGDEAGLQALYQQGTQGFLAVGRSMGGDGQKIVNALVDAGLATDPEIVALGVHLQKLTREEAGPAPSPGASGQAMSTEDFLGEMGFND